MISGFKIISLSFILMLTPCFLSAQKAERKSIREGNKLYNKEKYTESEISYRKALETNPKSGIGTYNLGNSLYKQEKVKEALEQYQIALSHENTPGKRSAIFHNSGNGFMQAKDYSNAVTSYRMSLRFNPSDNETRYNLAVAQAFLKNQQKQQQQQNKKDDKKQDQKDKKEQQKTQDDQEKKQNNQQKQEQQQQQEENVSKEKAQQLLDALTQDEKETQEKVRKLQMQQSKSKKRDKDW